jgi:hypothetical protein
MLSFRKMNEEYKKYDLLSKENNYKFLIHEMMYINNDYKLRSKANLKNIPKIFKEIEFGLDLTNPEKTSRTPVRAKLRAASLRETLFATRRLAL